MIRCCREAGLSEPVFALDDGLRISLGRPLPLPSSSVTTEETKKETEEEIKEESRRREISGTAPGKASSSREQSLAPLRSHPEVTIAELARQLNLSDSGVEYNLRKLRQEGRIRKQQARFATQQRESPRLVVERETHHLWGQPLLLQIQEVQAAPRVEVHPRRLLLFVRPQSSLQKRQSFLAAWYRQELRKEALPLIEIWQQCLVALRSPPLCRRLRSSQTRRIIAACQAPEPGRIYGEGSTPTSAHGIPRPGGASGLSNGHHRRAKGDQAR